MNFPLVKLDSLCALWQCYTKQAGQLGAVVSPLEWQDVQVFVGSPLRMVRDHETYFPNAFCSLLPHRRCPGSLEK